MSIGCFKLLNHVYVPVYEERPLIVPLRGYPAAQQGREERVRRRRRRARPPDSGRPVDEGLSGSGEVHAAHVEVHDLRRGGGGGGFPES